MADMRPAFYRVDVLRDRLWHPQYDGNSAGMAAYRVLKLQPGRVRVIQQNGTVQLFQPEKAVEWALAQVLELVQRGAT